MFTVPFDPYARFREPVGTRRDGRLIYPIAGGSTDIVEPGLTQPTVLTPEQLAAAREQLIAEGGLFTSDDVEKARSQEKDKLYPKIEDLKQRLDREAEEREAAKKRADDEAAAARKAAEDEERLAREEEMSAKDLLRERETEWQRQLREAEERLQAELQAERDARETERTLFAKEREYNELREYAAAAAEEHKDEIAPQLLSWITGNSRDEIDTAIARAIATTEELTTDMQQAVQASRAALPGVRPTAGPVDFDPAGSVQQLTQEQIAAMDMPTYAKYRDQLLRATGQQNKGMFG